MKRFLAIAFVLASCTMNAKADDALYFLNDDGSVELRLKKVESKVASLETRVAALEKSFLPPLANPKVSSPKVLKLDSNCGEASCPANGGPGCSCKNCPCTPAAAVPGVTLFQSGSSCANGQCSGSNQSTGWYPGKRLGRR